MMNLVEDHQYAIGCAKLTQILRERIGAIANGLVGDNASVEPHPGVALDGPIPPVLDLNRWADDDYPIDFLLIKESLTSSQRKPGLARPWCRLKGVVWARIDGEVVLERCNLPFTTCDLIHVIPSSRCWFLGSPCLAGSVDPARLPQPALRDGNQAIPEGHSGIIQRPEDRTQHHGQQRSYGAGEVCPCGS